MGLCPVPLIPCAGFSRDPVPNTSTVPFLPSSAPQGSAPMSSWWEGRGGLGGQRERPFPLSLGNVAKPLLKKPWECQGHASITPMAGTALFTPAAFLSAVHAVPGDHRGSEETNLWRLAVGAQRGEDATLAGLVLSESQQGQKSSLRQLAGLSPHFSAPYSIYFFIFIPHQNSVLLPSRCQVDNAAYQILTPLDLLFNLFLVKSLHWCTVITGTSVLSYHFIWTNQSPAKCVLKHIINNSTQINKAAGRGAGIDSHPSSWGFFLQFVLKRLQGCIHSQLVSSYCFIFFFFLLLLVIFITATAEGSGRSMSKPLEAWRRRMLRVDSL